ncbi:PaaI family thioesterase [Streptomyces sp. NPDC004539]|uniref:PaaI family thioesterase n=1 Tax=Streptomyces sp. NPDC004539 TaxID=3154280 RepID=UPI0033A72CB4
MTRKAAPHMDGTSAPGAATVRQQILDEIAARATPPPPYVVRLSLGVRALEWRPGFVAVTFHIPDDLCVEPGIAFGGHVAGLHDQAAGFAMYSVLEDDLVFATTRLDVGYLAVTRPGDVRLEARVAAADDRSAEVRVSLTQAGRVTSESVVTEAIRKAKK